MIFEKATAKDAPLLANAMQQIRASMDDPTMYVIDTEEDIRYSIDGIHGFALLAKEDTELAGFFIFRYPDIEEKDHLGVHLNLDDVQKNLLSTWIPPPYFQNSADRDFKNSSCWKAKKYCVTPHTALHSQRCLLIILQALTRCLALDFKSSPPFQNTADF